jgi:hypothetical protein
MKVKLGEGRALRDPVTHMLMKPDEVRDVPQSQFWMRRLRDGDVIPAQDTPAPEQPARRVPRHDGENV